jgi:protein O-GlcNAc transferase
MRQSSASSWIVLQQLPLLAMTMQAFKAPGRNDPCACGSEKKYKHCCAVGADEPSAVFERARWLHQAQNFTAAERLYRQVLHMEPRNADALHHLGLLAHQVGDSATALKLISRAISLAPSRAAFHYNLANIQRDRDDLPGANASFDRAIALAPEFVAAHINRAAMLHLQGRLDAALGGYEQALSIQPGNTDAMMNSAAAMRELGRFEAAVSQLRRLLALKPAHALARRQIRLAYDEWLFAQSLQASLSVSECLSVARGWEVDCLTSAQRQSARERHFDYPVIDGRRLRVGYVSGDFRQHAVAHFFETLLAHHDQRRVELFIYSNNPKGDEVTARIRQHANHWCNLVDLSDELARQRIANDHIDVLIDLAGHSAHNRLGVFALRAAPVQAHYLGYFATTGLTEMDYWIGDEALLPPGSQDDFSEALWRLPRLWIAYGRAAEAPAPALRDDDDQRGVWVGSFSNVGKLTPETFALWARVLVALPECRLLLKIKEIADVRVRARVVDALAERGIGSDRYELCDWSVSPDWHSHMAYYHRLDVALDTLGGVGGCTTTCEALLMAVPVVTLTGDRTGSRMTTSILESIGRTDWIARSEEDYIAKVSALVRDAAQRREIHSSLRAQLAGGAVFDSQAMARQLEDAYLQMHHRWLERR